MYEFAAKMQDWETRTKKQKAKIKRSTVRQAMQPDRKGHFLTQQNSICFFVFWSLIFSSGKISKQTRILEIRHTTNHYELET
jgi:hypothetical protein